jgi:hypothetical protein
VAPPSLVVIARQSASRVGESHYIGEGHKLGHYKPVGTARWGGGCLPGAGMGGSTCCVRATSAYPQVYDRKERVSMIGRETVGLRPRDFFQKCLKTRMKNTILRGDIP